MLGRSAIFGINVQTGNKIFSGFPSHEWLDKLFGRSRTFSILVSFFKKKREKKETAVVVKFIINHLEKDVFYKESILKSVIGFFYPCFPWLVRIQWTIESDGRLDFLQ